MTLTAELPGAPAAVRDETGDDGRHYIHPRTRARLVGVTNVLDATWAKPWIPAWREKITAGYAVDHLYRLLRIKKKWGRQAALDEARQQADKIRDLKRDVGSYVHRVVEAMVLWQASPEGTGKYLTLPELPAHLKGADYDDEPVEKVADRMIRGFTNWAADFLPGFIAAEMAVFSLSLGVGGTLDLIVELRGYAISPAGRFLPAPGHVVRLCVDIKTGKHLDQTVPEQISTYRRMEEALLPMGQLIPMPATDASAVLHLRPEYERGYRMMLVAGRDDAAAWNRFRRALELYTGRKAAKAKPGKVVYALRPDGTIPAPRIADLDGEGYGKALAPLIKAGITDLEQLAAMTPGQCLAVKGIGAKVLDTIRVMLADHGMHLAGETPQAPETAKAA